MCISCEQKVGNERIIRGYQFSHWVKSHANVAGKFQIMKNYILGDWTREFLHKYPKIVIKHTEGHEWDVEKVLAQCDEIITAHAGDRLAAWNTLNDELNKNIEDWAHRHDRHTPSPADREKALSKEELLENQAMEIVRGVSRDRIITG